MPSAKSYLFIIPIVFLYVYICSMGYDRITGFDTMERCYGGQECDAVNAKFDSAKYKKFVTLTVIAIGGFVIGLYMIKSTSDKYYDISISVIIASILLLIQQLGLNWNNIDRNMKLFLSVVAIVVIGYGSVKATNYIAKF